MVSDREVVEGWRKLYNVEYCTLFYLNFAWTPLCYIINLIMLQYFSLNWVTSHDCSKCFSIPSEHDISCLWCLGIECISLPSIRYGCSILILKKSVKWLPGVKWLTFHCIKIHTNVSSLLYMFKYHL